ncbi:hypothetical protein TKK_0006476 [Trichogramma kaykai]
MAELLLRHSANLNLTNEDRLTILHVICTDKSGNTPLHLALKYVETGTKSIVELLIRRGADIHVANAEGLSPLQIVCSQNYDKELVEVFFKTNTDIQQVEIRDNSVHKLLRSAMVNFQHDVVDIIFDHGADLSRFVFQTLICFSKRFDERYRIGDYRRSRGYDSKLKLVSGILSIIERLERKGYELDQSDALTIMNLFVRYEQQYK